MLLNILQCPLQTWVCYTYLSEWCISLTCLWWMLVSMVQPRIYQGVKPAPPTNCWPPGKGLLGTMVQKEPRDRGLGSKSISGMGPPCEKTTICQSHLCMQGSLSDTLLLELCSSFNSFFVSQISLCSCSLKIKDMTKQEKKRHLINLDKRYISLAYTLLIYKNGRCPL